MLAAVLAVACTAANGTSCPPPNAQADPERPPRILPNEVAFQKGAYTAFIAPFNVGPLVYRRDYEEAISIAEAVFPDASRITWSYPGAEPSAQIKAFLAIDYGNYNHTDALAPVPAATVGGIEVLALCVDLSVSGDLGGFDVIVDYYLTAAPGDLDAKLFEVEVALHPPAFLKTYADSVAKVGIYAAGDGTRWNVSVDPHAAMVGGRPDILAYPADGGDRLSGRIDLADFHRFLVRNGVITGGEWFNGLALGVEPRQGAGSLTIRSFAADYQVPTKAD